MGVLLHGTTLHRAKQIAAHGPNPGFVEPGGSAKVESFSTYLECGPFLFGTPEEYACSKAKKFEDEGGAAIIAVDVPDDIIALAVDELLFPLSQGLVQFDIGAGLEELRAAWSTLHTEIRLVECA